MSCESNSVQELRLYCRMSRMLGLHLSIKLKLNMTRFGILDDEPDTCVSPTLQLLNRVSAAAKASSTILGTSCGTQNSAHLHRPPSSTPPAIAQPQTTPRNATNSKDKRDFVDTVRLLSSPLAVKESHALQDAAWVFPSFFKIHSNMCSHSDNATEIN